MVTEYAHRKREAGLMPAPPPRLYRLKRLIHIATGPAWAGKAGQARPEPGNLPERITDEAVRRARLWER